MFIGNFWLCLVKKKCPQAILLSVLLLPRGLSQTSMWNTHLVRLGSILEFVQAVILQSVKFGVPHKHRSNLWDDVSPLTKITLTFCTHLEYKYLPLDMYHQYHHH